ncbi:LacI family DNA-binding transcriptional regulator (plasmid) [Coraliomargarita sp. W4R53]
MREISLQQNAIALDRYAVHVEARDRRPTIKDVALAAGVSLTTVSHALNGKRIVRKETVERVLRVADELGYRPSALARGLRESRMNVIALVLRPLDTLESFLPEGVDYFLRFAGAAALTAMERGYSLMLVSDPTKPDAPISTLAADVCIVTDPFENDPVITLLKRQRMPVVTVGADPARREIAPYLSTDTRTETVLVLDHLVEAGGTVVALGIGTDSNEWNTMSHAAYLEWCAARGQEPIVFINPETAGEAGGAAIAASAFAATSSSPRPDAVYCLTGRHAAGLVAAAAAHGLRVPEDLLVAGGSDAMQDRTSRPSVTALDLQPELVARLSVEVAVRLANGENIEGPIGGPPGVLRVRESTTRTAQ